MNNLNDCIELQDLAKGYVVIKENGKVIIEGFNTIVNTGRSFILSKIAKSAFTSALTIPGDGKYDYSDYTFYKAYLCENVVNTSTAPATTNESDFHDYDDFIARTENTRFQQAITVNNTTYDMENRDLILTFDISGNYSDIDSRVISSIILTIGKINENGKMNEVMFSRFTFDPKVITGNALIQINYHIHF